MTKKGTRCLFQWELPNVNLTQSERVSFNQNHKRIEDHPKLIMTSNSSHQVEIIGAGWGRTGTASLKAALEILGYPTYHMVENIMRNQTVFWIRCAQGEKVDFNEVFDLPDTKFTATCDLPSAQYWQEQLAQYPNAKVILTVRKPESWFKSASETILTAMPAYPGCHWAVKIGLSFGLPTPRFAEMCQRVVVEQAFGGDLSKEHLLEAFEQHTKDVQASCPPDKLLTFDVAEGWEPLCAFLGKPVPSVPFPRVNNTVEFQVHTNYLKWTGYAAVAGAVLLPVAAAAGAAYLWHRK